MRDPSDLGDKKMYKKTILLLLYCSCLQALWCNKEPLQHSDSAKQAKMRFDEMSNHQIHELDIHSLTQNQLQGFRELAREIYFKEVAAPGCYNKANLIKYEIMYQKIGELTACSCF